MSKITGKRRIQAELNRITKLFTNGDSHQRALLAPALENVAFMAVTLQDLQAEIIEKGATEIYTNGKNQSGVKVSAAAQAYNQLLKGYNTTVKILLGMLPPGERKQAASALSLYRQPPTPEEEEADRKRREEEADYWAEEARKLLEQNG